jgi:serine/threonine-protein kinase
MRSELTLLRAYVARYADRISGLRYSDLKQLQPPPFATLAHGGAGTAYALWRLGQAARARAWIAASLADRSRTAFDPSTRGFDRGSILYGRAGLRWLEARLGGRSRARAVAGYMRQARAGADHAEHASGRAGQLAASRLLLAERDDAIVRAHGCELASALLGRLRARTRTPWQPLDAVGFAHEWPGVIHAVLAWLIAAPEAVPGWLADSVRDLAAAWSPDVTRVPDLAASWCNGAAGTVLLWCQAHDAIGGSRFLEAARAAGERALAAPRVTSDLCCGDAGVAYALLALARIDRRRAATWRARAIALAVRAIREPVLRWPSGLYRGHPGVVCLALDLLEDRGVGARFPVL